MSKIAKIGIFGGAFNPPHNGHINIAAETKKALNLDKMLIIPTKVSPHKETSAVEFSERVNMCKLAFEELSGFEVSDIEGKLPSPNYTINTVRYLKERVFENSKDTDFYLLIGADMLFYFDKWHDYKSVLRECNVVAAARSLSGNSEKELAEMREFAQKLGNIKILELKTIEVSSNEVRTKIANNQNVSGLVPEKVLDYIKERKLYEKC